VGRRSSWAACEESRKIGVRSIPFALAQSLAEYRRRALGAPAVVCRKSHFFDPMQNGRMAFSTRLWPAGPGVLEERIQLGKGPIM